MTETASPPSSCPFPVSSSATFRFSWSKQSCQKANFLLVIISWILSRPTDYFHFYFRTVIFSASHLIIVHFSSLKPSIFFSILSHFYLFPSSQILFFERKKIGKQIALDASILKHFRETRPSYRSSLRLVYRILRIWLTLLSGMEVILNDDIFSLHFILHAYHE